MSSLLFPHSCKIQASKLTLVWGTILRFIHIINLESLIKDRVLIAYEERKATSPLL